MAVWIPPVLFIAGWLLALFGVDPPGSSDDPSFDEALLLWVLYLGVGWASIGAGLAHTVFAKDTAKGIGWESGPFQYEVGFANFGIGLGAIYAVHSGTGDAWVAASIAGGVFVLLAGVFHIRNMVKAHNYAPGNSVMLIQDLGTPATLFVTLLSTGLI